ncbi:MAG: hypothetical protein ACFCUU_02290 [Cyclobacteriaceae bacterium]
MEAEKLKSPYFDYANAEVKDALTGFINTLSRHILIGKEDLRPLLVEATYQTLVLLLFPFEYYIQEFSHPSIKHINTEKLAHLNRYIKLNGSMLFALEEALEKNNQNELHQDEAISLIHDFFKENPDLSEDHSNLIRLFSETIPLETSKFIGDNPASKVTYVESSTTDQTAKTKDEKGISKTVNDTYDDTSNLSLAEKLRRQKVDDLKKSMSINQRFMFVNTLFKSDNEAFDQTIQFINECVSREVAMDYIEKNCLTPYEWDLESEEVQEFLDMLDKRFDW